MAVIHGRFVKGTIIPDVPLDWEEGTEVTVSRVEDEVEVGMREEDWPTTPEGIAALIESIKNLEPVLSTEEEESWLQALAEQKAFEKANALKRMEKIEEIFQ